MFIFWEENHVRSNDGRHIGNVLYKVHSTLIVVYYHPRLLYYKIQSKIYV